MEDQHEAPRNHIGHIQKELLSRISAGEAGSPVPGKEATCAPLKGVLCSDSHECDIQRQFQDGERGDTMLTG